MGPGYYKVHCLPPPHLVVLRSQLVSSRDVHRMYTGYDNDLHNLQKTLSSTVKPVLSGYSKRRPKCVFKTDHRLMQVKCNGSIQQ